MYFKKENFTNSSESVTNVLMLGVYNTYSYKYFMA